MAIGAASCIENNHGVMLTPAHPPNQPKWLWSARVLEFAFLGLLLRGGGGVANIVGFH